MSSLWLSPRALPSYVALFVWFIFSTLLLHVCLLAFVCLHLDPNQNQTDLFRLSFKHVIFDLILNLQASLPPTNNLPSICHQDHFPRVFTSPLFTLQLNWYTTRLSLDHLLNQLPFQLDFLITATITGGFLKRGFSGAPRMETLMRAHCGWQAADEPSIGVETF
jgi:hypothetical protein